MTLIAYHKDKKVESPHVFYAPSKAVSGSLFYLKNYRFIIFYSKESSKEE